jgi:hypothetical protein
LEEDLRVGEALTKSRNWRADLGGAMAGGDEDMLRQKGVFTALVEEDENVNLAVYARNLADLAGI